MPPHTNPPTSRLFPLFHSLHQIQSKFYMESERKSFCLEQNLLLKDNTDSSVLDIMFLSTQADQGITSCEMFLASDKDTLGLLNGTDVGNYICTEMPNLSIAEDVITQWNKRPNKRQITNSRPQSPKIFHHVLKGPQKRMTLTFSVYVCMCACVWDTVRERERERERESSFLFCIWARVQRSHSIINCCYIDCQFTLSYLCSAHSFIEWGRTWCWWISPSYVHNSCLHVRVHLNEYIMHYCFLNNRYMLECLMLKFMMFFYRSLLKHTFKWRLE